MPILKDLKLENTNYQKESLLIIMSSSMEKTCMTNPLILISNDMKKLEN